MPTSAIQSWSGAQIIPLYNPDQAYRSMVQVALPANVVYPQGTILGQVTATPGLYKAYTDTAFAVPAAPTVTDSATAGNWSTAPIRVAATYTTVDGETLPGPTTAFTPVGNKLLHLAAVTLPAGATAINYYAGIAEAEMVQIGTSANGAAADYDVPTTANPPPTRVNAAYTVSDGSENPTCILQYPCATDANGNITLGTVAGGDPLGITYPVAPAFTQGDFSTADLKQSGAGSIDARAVAKLGRLIWGTTSAGCLHVG